MALSRRLEKIRNKLFTTNEYGYEHQDPEARLSSSDVAWLEKNHDIRTDVHPMCINCQVRQLIKYMDFKDKKGRGVDGFKVRCDMVPNALPQSANQLLRQMVTQQDMDKDKALLYVKSGYDPVSWVELVFGFRDANVDWRLRSYQKEQIRCNAKRMVIRQGRRSGKTFAIAAKLLHAVFNMKVLAGVDAVTQEPKYNGPRIMVVTPYQAQVSNVFSQMEDLLRNNKELESEVTTGTGGNLYVKTPNFRMEFKNGASIQGFVSGVGAKSDGSAGGTIRGQNADIIYMDEMDMIPEEVLDQVILPIRMTTGEVIVIGTSTPIGKRAKFFDWCNTRPDFKEDYFPSTVLPQWDVVKYEIEEEGSTEESFKREYMAHFIEGTYGVFKPDLVYRARGAYTYDDCSLSNGKWWQQQARVAERSKLIKVMGIDWNKNAGAQFVVVAYDPNRHHWFVVEATEISGSDFHSVTWKEEVVRLNLKWKPDYIYADEGYGHTIIDDLKVHAFRLASKPEKTPDDIETIKLLERLKAFSFSSTVTLNNPIDGTPIVKKGKQFLVENAVRVFEERRIWFPEDDNILLNQLLHYVVLRYTPETRKPIYGTDSKTIGDHRLDALMLALGGIFLERSMYARNTAGSTPQMFSREELESLDDPRRAPTAAELLQAATKAGIPGSLKVLEIRRGDGSPGTEERIQRIYQAEEELKREVQQRRRNRRRRRPREEEESPSLFKTLWARARSSAGFDTDEEAIAQLEAQKRFEKASKPGIVRRRSHSRGGRAIKRRRST